MKSVRLTLYDYHILSLMVLQDIEFLKDDSKKVSYLKKLLHKLDDHMHIAFCEENKNYGDDDDE